MIFKVVHLHDGQIAGHDHRFWIAIMVRESGRQGSQIEKKKGKEGWKTKVLTEFLCHINRRSRC